ncbi:hypothetical protein LJC59_08575, partial [Desulfovibrio sp. OttesenSCG-928-A18]|nr:hypothetical protein [Desulfovibrio sp. OttesenSCG-928-A18]
MHRVSRLLCILTVASALAACAPAFTESRISALESRDQDHAIFDSRLSHLEERTTRVEAGLGELRGQLAPGQGARGAAASGKSRTGAGASGRQGASAAPAAPSYKMPGTARAERSAAEAQPPAASGAARTSGGRAGE